MVQIYKNYKRRAYRLESLSAMPDTSHLVSPQATNWLFVSCIFSVDIPENVLQMSSFTALTIYGSPK